MSQVIKHTNVNSFAAAVRAAELPFVDASANRRAGAFLTLSQLETYLTDALRGLSVSGLALKTRSAFIRQQVFAALGYEVPKRARAAGGAPTVDNVSGGALFGAQNADIYVQKSNNLQVWNEKLDVNRRYLVVIVDEADVVAGVRAFTGRTLAKWSRTGTLTSKFQASLKLVFSDAVPGHVCGRDTERTVQFIGRAKGTGCASAEPALGTLLSIQDLGAKLTKLIGTTVPYISAVDDKKRSAALSAAVGNALGYNDMGDTAVFPKIPAQMLEVKLQTSDTIDLGRTWPSSDSPLNFQGGRARMLRRRDVRFAVFYGTRIGDTIRLDKVVITPGERFWDVFATLQGKLRNTKLQIRLPEEAMAVA
jgi:hypothetical protein